MSQRRRIISADSLEVEEASRGLWVNHGEPPLMETSHRHNDIEVNYVARGELHYLFGGETLTVKTGEIAIFWAALPHKLVPSSHGEMYWIHVPLQDVLRWSIPTHELGELLKLEPLIVASTSLPYRADLMFKSWYEELGGTVTDPIAFSEAPGVIRRIIRGSRRPEHGADLSNYRGIHSPAKLQHVADLSSYTVEHFREPISITEIAAAVHLSASYAMNTFKSVTGMTLGKYLTWCRIAEAQRLLMTTALSVTEIGTAAGFGSQSSFYELFTRECGTSPAAYRAALPAREMVPYDFQKAEGF